MMDTTQAVSEIDPTILPPQEDPDPFGDTPPDPDPGPPKG
jgi:hypothetical protein